VTIGRGKRPRDTNQVAKLIVDVTTEQVDLPDPDAGKNPATRLTNGHSRKIDNHRHAVALHYMYYNFCKVHQTLRVTPAMEGGLSDHVWSLEELVGLLAQGETRATA
jgi:hypothetical protein